MKPKHLVTTIASLLVICAAITAALYISQMHFLSIGQGSRFFLISVLSWLLIRGWNPGRWITAILMSIAAIGSLGGGLILAQESMRGIPYIVIGAVYGACVVGLLTPLARAYFIKTSQAEHVVGGNGG